MRRKWVKKGRGKGKRGDERRKTGQERREGQGGGSRGGDSVKGRERKEKSK